MSKKFHVNDSGVAGVCKARVNPCRFGEENHYESKLDANAAGEEKIKDQTGQSSFSTISKTRKPKVGPKSKSTSSLPSKSRFNSETRRIRFNRQSSPELIQHTASSLEKFYSNPRNSNKMVRIEDNTGFATGVNFVEKDEQNKDYVYGKLRYGNKIVFSRNKDIQPLLQEAADDNGYDKEDEVIMDA